MQTKHSSWERRSLWLVTLGLGFLFLVSVFSVLVTDELVSPFWRRIRGSFAAVLSAQKYSPEEDVADDPTCLSRTQQYLYRRGPKTPLLPIPVSLREEWEKYGELHKSCSSGKNWTDVYLKREQVDTCKYLVYLEGREGLGNGILSLTSAFAVALATGRVLLIDSRKNIANLLCEPFPGSSWVLPDDFPYEDLQKRQPGIGDFVRSNFNSSVVSLNLQHTLTADDSQIFCEDHYSSLEKAKWIAWTSNQYFIPNFLLVPSFWRRMQPLFHDVQHIFTFLSRLLFLPRNDTWAIILREYWTYLSCAKSRLGVQVRLHGRSNLAEFDTFADEKIMECLVDKSLLPSLSSSSSPNNTSDLSKLYNRKVRSGEASADIVVLLASLQGKYYQTMKDRYSQLATKDVKLVRVHSVSQEGFERRDFHQAQLAMVDMWLLSYSDNLATSAYSTLGYVAQALGDLHPYILSLRKSKEEQNEALVPACVLGQSPEPCTHYPRKPACLGNLSDEHKQWISSHLRHCQDQPRGWQLVDGSPAEQGGARVSFDFN